MGQVKIREEGATPASPSEGVTIYTTSATPTIPKLKTKAGTIFVLGETGTWTPDVQGTGSNPTVTYTARGGQYVVLGNICFFHFDIQINTISGGSGNLRVTLPKTNSNAANSYVSGHFYSSGVDLPGTPVSVFFQVVGNQAYGEPLVVQDNGALAAVLLSGVLAGDVFSASGWYFVTNS